MDIPDVLRSVGAVAGLGGIAIAAVLIFNREAIRKNIFPKLDRERGYQVIRLLATFMFLIGLAGISSWTYVSVVHANNANPEKHLNERLAQANVEYDWYPTDFAAAVKFFAHEHLEEIFAECLAQVSAQDPTVPYLLAGLRALPIGDDKQRNTLREQVTAKILPHRPLVEKVIFDRFNTRLMDQLRSLASASQYSPWMTRALLEWTHRKNDNSWLVQGCITQLLADDKRLGSWLYAYIRAAQEPKAWDKTSTDAENMRFDLLSTLERLVGSALNDGRQELLDQVRLNYPSMSALPSPPKPR